MAEISIIIPVYNVGQYLEQCLDSVLAQTFVDFEVICINDGSTDKSDEILKQYASKDSRIKIITQQNSGVSVARNAGKSQATGKYIYIMDGDDCIHPRLLEIAYTFAQKHNADMVEFGFEKSKDISFAGFCNKMLKSIDKIKYKVSKNPLYHTKKRCDYKIHFPSWSKLYKRDFINDIGYEKMPYFEDALHTFMAVAKSPKTVIIKEKLYYYEDNPNSLSKFVAQPKHIKGYHKGLNIIYEIYKKGPKKYFDFLIKEVFSNVLKQQYNKIKQSPKENQPELWNAFREELVDLNNKVCIRLRGNKLLRYFVYKKLIKGKV